MRPTRRVERDPSGTWTAVSQGQAETTADNQAVANRDGNLEQSQTQGINSNQGVVNKHRNTQSQSFNWKRWKIEPTTNRTQMCLSTFISITQLLSLLAVIFFWIAFFMFFKSLIFWQGTQRIVEGFMRRRELVILQRPIQPDDSFLHDLFPDNLGIGSYQLYVEIAESALEGAVIFYSWRFSLWLTHPFTWLLMMFIFFMSYRLLSFVRGCLQHAHRATRTCKKLPA